VFLYQKQGAQERITMFLFTKFNPKFIWRKLSGASFPWYGDVLATETRVRRREEDFSLFH
jgi:hypothetical protein